MPCQKMILLFIFTKKGKAKMDKITQNNMIIDVKGMETYH